MNLTSSFRYAVILAVSMTELTLLAQTHRSGEVSLCSIAARVDDYKGHLVTVRARIYSGGVHGWQIADEACKRFGLALFLPNDVQGSEAFFKSVNFVGMDKHPVYGTFTGTFEIQENHEAPPRILRVQTMRGFSSDATESEK